MGKRKKKNKNLNSSKLKIASVSTPEKKLTSYTDLPNYVNRNYTGEKFPTGFGDTSIFALDYWTLRKRSAQLFTENLYARGLIRRLVTNIINIGIFLEATPDARILKKDEEFLSNWSDEVESRFELWTKNPLVCDYKQKKSFSQIQQVIALESLVSGDVLVIEHISVASKSTNLQIVSGDAIQTPFPMPKLRNGHKIVEGVELDSRGRHVAFHIVTDQKESKRIPAYGEKSKRRISWLVYGSDKRMSAVRGQPILSLALQALKETDRYKDAALRKAVVNSFVAMYIKKTQDKPGTLPLSGGAVRKDAVPVVDGDGSARTFDLQGHIPGLMFEELQQGEEPVPVGGQGIDINFGAFEESIIQGIAWGNQIPPEILKMAFSNNYSASQAAINEFKSFLDVERGLFGMGVCQPGYEGWLINEVYVGRIEAPGLIESWADLSQYDIYGAWVKAEWLGAIKPSTDLKKQTQGYKLAVDNCWMTNTKVAREISGQKFGTIVKQLRKENLEKAKAMRPLLELQQEFGEQAVNNLESKINDITDILEGGENE